MIEALQSVFDRAAQLSEEDQRALAEIVEEKLASQAWWNEHLAETHEAQAQA